MVRISGPIFILCKGIKREAACRLAFDFRSCHARSAITQGKRMYNPP